MDVVLTFLNSDVAKWFLGLVIGRLGKKAETFVTKAVPLLILVANFLLGLAAAIAGVSVAHASPFGAVIGGWFGVGPLAKFILSPLTNAVVMTGLSIGTHSGAKNLWQWLQNGAGLVASKDDARTK